jgi:predicted kinase
LHRALLLTGVAGVGKSTVADAIGGVLTAAGLVTAVIDTDALAQFGPPPEPGEGRPTSFYDHLKCLNLAAVWANYQAAGARFVVVSAGIDSVPLRSEYAGGLAGCEVQMVRLIAATDTVRKRLQDRDSEAKLERHLRMLAEEEAGHEAAAIEDFTVRNDRPAAVVAREIIARAGWIDPPGSTQSEFHQVI